MSARTGEGVDRLEAVLREQLPEGEPLYPADYLTDRPERFFVGRDRAREGAAATHATSSRSRAPSSSISFEEPDERGLMRLFCTILVDRDSQKPIVVGRGGAMIRQIGTEAREDLERFFQARVFLDLRVKVRARLARRRSAAR